MSIPNSLVLFIERLLYAGAVLSVNHAFLPQQHQEIGDVTIPISKMKKVKHKWLVNEAGSHIWFQGLCSLVLYTSFSSRSMSRSPVLHATLGFILNLPLPLWGPHANTTFSHRDLCCLASVSLLSFGSILLQMRGVSIEPLVPHIGAGWGGEWWAKRNELERHWEFFSLTPPAPPQATFRTDDLRKLLLFYLLVTKNIL